jgi:hypothetical protein
MQHDSIDYSVYSLAFNFETPFEDLLAPLLQEIDGL